MATDSRTAGVLSPLMPRNADDETFIRKWIAQILGLKLSMVRPRWQQRPTTIPEINESWCSFGIESIENEGLVQSSRIKDETSDVETQGEEVTFYQKMNCSARLYGPNSLLLSQVLVTGINVWQNNEELRNAGLAIRYAPKQADRIPDFIMGQWLNCFEVKFTIGRKLTHTYGVRQIASVGPVTIEYGR